MESQKTRRKRTRRVSSHEVVDVTANGASSSVAIVDLTKDSNDSSILSGDIVDLTDTNVEEVTPPKQQRGRRRRSAQQVGSGTSSVIISSGDESDNDNSDDLILLNSPLPSEASFTRLNSATPKKAIKCPICYDDYATIRANGIRLMSTNCGHVFCETCIKMAITSQHKCPTCRRKLLRKQIHPLFL